MIELAVAALSMFGSVGAAFFSAYPQIRGSGGFAAAASNIDARRRLRKAAYIAVAFSAMIGVLVFILSTRINPPDDVKPLSVPSGFESFSWQAGRVGFAVPETWTHEDTPIVTQFSGSSGNEFLSVIVQGVSKEELRQFEANPQAFVSDLGASFESVFQGISVTGKPVKRSHQGRTGFIVPIRWSAPGVPSIDGYRYSSSTSSTAAMCYSPSRIAMRRKSSCLR